MATLPPPPEPTDVPEPAQANPWDSWQAAGIDPNYDPHQAREAMNFWRALGNRDQREYAIQQVASDFLPEGMSIAQARDILSQQAQPPDPWEQFEPSYPDEPEYQPQAPQFDPRALQGAIDQEIERRLEERDMRDAQERRQAEYEAEFTNHVDRVGDEHDFDQNHRLWLAAMANVVRGEMPHATMKDVMDEAGKRALSSLNQRLQALTQAQQDHPAAPLPGGSVPSPDQVPQDVEQARAAARQFFRN